MEINLKQVTVGTVSLEKVTDYMERIITQLSNPPTADDRMTLIGKYLGARVLFFYITENLTAPADIQEADRIQSELHNRFKDALAESCGIAFNMKEQDK